MEGVHAAPRSPSPRHAHTRTAGPAAHAHLVDAVVRCIHKQRAVGARKLFGRHGAVAVGIKALEQRADGAWGWCVCARTCAKEGAWVCGLRG